MAKRGGDIRQRSLGPGRKTGTAASSGDLEVTTQLEQQLWRRDPEWTYILPLANEKTFMTEIPGIRRPEISTLPIEG
ncbi:hypothetical protein CRENBAI_026740, partial [Crenichthys baileyi]